jgi:hypothetical protein
MSEDPHVRLIVDGDKVGAVEPLIDLAVVYPYWDGLLHPRWVTKEEMKKMFPEFTDHHRT